MIPIESQTINNKRYAIEAQGKMYKITQDGTVIGISTTLIGAQQKFNTFIATERGGENEMKDAQEKAREVAEKLRVDKTEKENVEKENMAVAKEELSQLAKVSGNEALAKMYNDSSDLGAENLAGELPLLKVHSAGRSMKNELVDGTEPKDGSFFYKPNKQEFQSPITCHILTISKGFRAPGMEGNKEVFNQIVGGLILDEGEYLPFLMYVTGLKLSYLWEFGKVASRYTKGKPVRIPMFAMKVQLTTERIPNSIGGKSWIVKYDIQKDEAGYPLLVLDQGEFQFIKATAEELQETIAQLIAAKQTPDDTTENAQVITGQTVEETAPDEMPFA